METLEKGGMVEMPLLSGVSLLGDGGNIIPYMISSARAGDSQEFREQFVCILATYNLTFGA